jgi:serine/threonine protein kinase
METALPHQLVAGRYVLHERIGAGGMATVWRAEDRVLARVVAVKLLREDLAQEPSFLERFQREAVSAARLTHPNIVSVFDAGMDGALSFIVMEHVPGDTLRKLLDLRGPLEPSAAAGVMLPVLTALGCAHNAGIVHRDLKPENVMLGPGGRVKVADFGLAKASAAHRDPTTSASMVGAATYLSPEQVEGGEITPASDVYAAGILLYELLTGRTPFEADTDLATAMLRLARDPMPPSAVRGGIPRELDRVVAKALARNPNDRYTSAEGMRAALERFTRDGRPPLAVSRSESPATHERPAPSSAFRSWMLVPLAVLVATGALVAAGLGLGRLEIGGPLGIRAASASPPAAPAEKPAATLTIVSATSYDPPPGDGSEHPESTGLAIDGNPETVWPTDHYASAAFGNLKTGVGLWLALDGPQQVRTVTIRSPVPGWSFRLFGGGAPSTTGSPLASTSGQTTFTIPSSGTLTLATRPVRTHGLLVWITSLATGGGRYDAEIGEVSITGVAP